MRGCLLFDFFGTLVSYSSSWTEQGYDRSYQMLREFGTELSYDGFLDTWTKTAAEFEERAAVDHHEYSMAEACSAFLATALGRTPSEPETATFVALYVEEWNAGVSYLPGIAELLAGLAERYRLAVVSNTHQPDLVQGHLRAMRVLPLFDTVVTSVELGWRKPHPTIYATALDRLRVGASDAWFVGDSYEPDHVGPERAGIRAFLIDPDGRHPVPEERRLDSVFELPRRLSETA